MRFNMIRVFPRRTKWTPTDDLAFVGDPPLFRPPEMPVKISVTFTWDIEEGKRLYRAWKQYYQDVQLGGPAFGDSGLTFTPGMFIKKGVTFTSRGCPNKCPWCFVPKREGGIRPLGIFAGNIVQDNNLLACNRMHLEIVFNMLQQQNEPVTFSGGLDTRLLKQWHVGWLKNIKIKEIWVACDSDAHLKYLERAGDLLSDFPINKKRCYVMIGYGGETLDAAKKRLERVYRLGFLPFSQLYQPIHKYIYSKPWRDLNRMYSRPAIYRGNLE